MFRAKVTLNPGALSRSKAKLKQAPKHFPQHRVTVGIHEDEGSATKVDYYGKGIDSTLAEVAAVHEFGAGPNPSRSWLRSWFDLSEKQLQQDMIASMNDEYKGDSTAVAKQAKAWAGELRDWIQLEHGNLEELAATTIARKTAAELSSPSTPLLATGQLVKAITAKVDGVDA
jgi:hypothetical protein